VRSFITWALLLLAAVPGTTMTMEERRLYLQKLQGILESPREWNEWLARTGELPPDFDALPANAYLPDPLVFQDGKPVRTAADWTSRQTELRKLFEHYFTGTFPPRPKELRAVTLDSTLLHRATSKRVRLEFGPGFRGHLGVELFIPEGRGPFPVMLGPAWTHDWAFLALRRGYLCAVYAGSDSWDEAAPLAQLYPDYDFALIARRAWAGQRVLDYLETVPQADMTRVGITGHSRDGKQALISAAFDERIRAVIPSSSGSFGATPFRFVSEKYFSESIERKTRVDPTWFSPRMRFFVGQEHRLPFDQNLLVALVAPRSCLLSSALNDNNDCVFGVEQCYRSALQAYKFLGHPERLGIRWRSQLHGTHPRDIEEYMDWFDIQFGRAPGEWKTELLFNFDFDKWKAEAEKVDVSRFPAQQENIDAASLEDWQKKEAGIRERIEWMLGEKPPLARKVPRPGAASDTIAVDPARPVRRREVYDDMAMLGLTAHAGWQKRYIERTGIQQIMFGDYLVGDLYYPLDAPAAGRKLPVVIWLHGYGYMTGYQWAYRPEVSPIAAMVSRGFAVFAFEMNGFGSRITEPKSFYRRYPRWSRLANMIEDTRAAIDVLQTVELVDARRIYALGYSIGGTVGLYTAALDGRLRGVVSICGFTPMRLDTRDKGTEGVARYSQLHGFVPKLGFFVGAEARIPYDFHEILALIAPRPLLVVAPELDRDATLADVKTAVAQARKVYALRGQQEALRLETPFDYNRLSSKVQDAVLTWMEASFR
jgi:pimeloyl-ACP methyl ester carboxylesterase